MKSILPFFLLLFFYFVKGQEREATIIFNDSSKVSGFGEIKNNKIYFRASEKDKIDVWSYDITKGIDFDGMGYNERYEYITSDRYNKPVLMEVIDDGEINLYKDFARNIGPTFGVGASSTGSLGAGVGIGLSELEPIYFVKRKNEKKALELTFSFKARSQRIFSDCETLLEKIKKREFTKKNIPDLVAYYNNYCYKENP